MRKYSWLLPVVFIAVVVVLCTGALMVIAALTQKNIGTLDLDGQDLKVRLDELRSTLQLLILAAGLFAVAQGAAAFFNAQTFTKQADDAIKRMQDQSREAENRYPMFARGEMVRREAYASLSDIFRDPFFLDWRTSAYERLDLVDRQRLVSVERFIGIELLPHPGGPEEYVRDLRRLANFYASKHRFDASKGQAQWTDLERSEYYLKLAIREASDDNYHLITDLGVLYMEFYSPRRLDEAEAQFRTSMDRMKNQQRAVYNLGVAARYRKDWVRTLDYYEKALRCNNWERRPLDEMRAAILYNKACALARFSYENPAQRDDLVAQCLTALQQTCDGGPVELAYIDSDLNQPDGAFFQLTAEAKLKIEDLKGQLASRKPVVNGEHTFTERLRAAVKVLRGTA